LTIRFLISPLLIGKPLQSLVLNASTLTLTRPIVLARLEPVVREKEGLDGRGADAAQILGRR